MLHIYLMCGIFYLSSIDTGTMDRQFNVSSSWDFADEGPWEFWVSHRGIEPRTPSGAGECLNH